MDDLTHKLNATLDQLEQLYDPISIFLYGSRARTDFVASSDYEIGVIMSRDTYVGRRTLSKSIFNEGVRIYPFKYEDFMQRQLDTPFQKSIYLRELANSARTLRGKLIVEEMYPPPIKLIDVIQELRFNLGYATASLLSLRNGDQQTASTTFYKSCLFGTRCLEIFLLRRFPSTYDQIRSWSGKLDLGEYTGLIEFAYNVRNGQVGLDNSSPQYLNLSYLNDYIEGQLMAHYNHFGDEVLIPEGVQNIV